MKGNIANVLQRYPIQPVQMELYDKVAKVEAAEGIFALKETQLNNEQAERFLQTLRFFEKQQMNTVLPVLGTTYQEWCVIDDDRLYYLTPWKQSCAFKRHESAYFKTLAIFHRSTEYKEAVPESIWEEQGKLLKKERDQQLLQLEAYADQIEKKHYYSPFELSFLMHFPLLYQCHKDSLTWYEKWESAAYEEKGIRVVRCHGSPSPDHMVLDERNNYQFINLEQTADGHPLYDVSWLYRSCMQERMWDTVQAYPWVKTYHHHFPLKRGEDALLKSQLLNESFLYPFLATASKRKLYDEHTFTFQLEEHIWMMEKIKQDLDTWPSFLDEKENT
ncbi:spore coat protein YsxE [Alteribacillus persepolensis]|uniref:Spore coat protein YsxE n=1 Tax=Alteribacillus persepolensis TaxID=568899 RepID=A0A1G8JX68_9BACI|nr:phosphotransferase [Alteribacillus persepolensis]SDI35796.1 spore coat protein YsxE [Alteribacillus persepolensis]